MWYFIALVTIAVLTVMLIAIRRSANLELLADRKVAASPAQRSAAPYTEHLSQLVTLLQIYCMQRGILPSDVGDKEKDGLARSITAAAWPLSSPTEIIGAQLRYVDEHVSPSRTHGGSAATPLSILTEYYNATSAAASGSLRHRAVETELEHNDDGYATHVSESPTFYDASHVQRRGYGAEGSIFVSVPFAAHDIGAAQVAGIRRRRDTAVGQFGGRNTVVHTMAHCAATVSSLLGTALWPSGVTVGVVDLVVASGHPSEANLTVTEPDLLLNTTATTTTKYDVFRCIAPHLLSGAGQMSFGFVVKDNIRTRKVVVPLTMLRSGAPRRKHWGLPIAHAVRYATLRLYRGESYVLLLKAGTAMVTNWDVKMRLLHLHSPFRERAVLSSRPSRGLWRDVIAGAVAHVLHQHRSLALPLLRTGEPVRSEMEWLEYVQRRDTQLIPWLVLPLWLRAAVAEKEFALHVDRDEWASNVFTKELQQCYHGWRDGEDDGDDAVVEDVGGPGGDFRRHVVPVTWMLATGATVEEGADATKSALLHCTSITERDLLLFFLARPTGAKSPGTRAAEPSDDAPPHAAMAAEAQRCGSVGTPYSFLTYHAGSLEKRHIEWCWFLRHQSELRSTMQRLLDSMEDITTLQSRGSSTADGVDRQPHQSGVSGTEAITTAEGQQTRDPRFVVELRESKLSDCLYDMRYMNPYTFDESSNAAGASDSSAADLAYWSTAGSVGRVTGVACTGSAVPTCPPPGHENGTSDTGRSAMTPSLLQGVASSALLFAPAEAFFNTTPSHRLRTRLYTAEQVTMNQTAPQAADLLPQLQFLTAEESDEVLSVELWMKGWNFFAFTEPVAAGDEETNSLEATMMVPTAKAMGAAHFTVANATVSQVLQKALSTSQRRLREYLEELQRAERPPTPPSRLLKDYAAFLKVPPSEAFPSLRE